MGHEDIETTRRYVTVTKEHKYDAIALAFGPGPQVGHNSTENHAEAKTSTGK
jgi:hypothetical protein